MDHGCFGPQGVRGGKDGAVNMVTVWRNGESSQPPHLSKQQDIPLKSGDRVVVATPGGGGYGDPMTRDPEAKQDVILNGTPISRQKNGLGLSLTQMVKLI